MSQLNDEEVLRVLCEAAVVAPPSRAATAHGARVLALALDADAKARARWTSGRVAAVAFAAAASTGALALAPVLASTARSDSAPFTTATATHDCACAPEDLVASDRLSHAAERGASLRVTDDIDVAPSIPAVALRSANQVAPEPLARAAPRMTRARSAEPAWLVQDGGREDGAGASLARGSHDAMLALAGVRTAEAMRLRCQHSLLHVRDQTAMEACRAFGQEHPQDAAARWLSFAGGRLAEDLGDLVWAEEEYSRSLLLSPFSGLLGTDALLARARVRFAAGDVGEARADLRLYLYREPAARHEPAVAELAVALGL